VNSAAWGLGDQLAFEQTLTVGVLVLARLAPLVLLAPWLSLRAFPFTVRASVALVLAAALTPMAMATGPAPCVAVVPLYALALRELIVGALFALAASLPFYALGWAGQYADIWRGAAGSEIIAPVTGESSSPLGELYLYTAIVLFFSLGGHRLALSAFAATFDAVPVGASFHAAALPSTIWASARLFGRAFAFSAMLAAPVAIVLVTTEIALGIVNRIAPEIAFALGGMPLRAAVGLAAVLLAISYCLSLLGPAFGEALGAAARLVRMLTSSDKQ
jgi:type III secretory pathway component EscT